MSVITSMGPHDASHEEQPEAQEHQHYELTAAACLGQLDSPHSLCPVTCMITTILTSATECVQLSFHLRIANTADVCCCGATNHAHRTCGTNR